MLALSPDDPAALSAYVARHNPNVKVNIEFATRGQITGDLVIVPVDGSRTFRLRFALPAVLADWLLRDDSAAVLRARDRKAVVLSSIAVFLDGRLVRLLFSPRRRG